MQDDPHALEFPLATITASAVLLNRAISGYADVTYDFVRLCEEAIHKAGTWPADVPYPLHPPR